MQIREASLKASGLRNKADKLTSFSHNAMVAVGGVLAGATAFEGIEKPTRTDPVFPMGVDINFDSDTEMFSGLTKNKGRYYA